MAARHSVIVSIAGLLFLLLLVPAVAAAGGHASGGQKPGDLSTGAAGATAGAGERIAAAPQDRAAPGLAAPLLAGGRGYRADSDLPPRLSERSASTREPWPEITRIPARTDVLQPQAALVRGVPGGAARGGEPEPVDPPGGHHRGSPADPMPYAAPTRAPHEQNGSESGAQGGRGRKDAPHLPVPVAEGTGTPDPILLLRFLLVLGFRRVRPANVLEHPLRRALHASVRSDPGLDLAGCAAATGANRETLRYHLALLVCCGKVTEEARFGSVRYFPHDPALTPGCRALLHALRNESLAPILVAIRDAPGISRQELADRLGVTGPSVSRQVSRLIEDGLVRAGRCGRSQCYRLTATSLELDPAQVTDVDAGRTTVRVSA